MERLISSETIAKEAIAAAEADGIVFIDEIDKIVTSSETRYGADASSEGVQRDLLPIIEGSTVSTKWVPSASIAPSCSLVASRLSLPWMKSSHSPATVTVTHGRSSCCRHGNVETDHILFICSGAFHSSKPKDMLAELQGRLPIRVELKVCAPPVGLLSLWLSR